MSHSTTQPIPVAARSKAWVYGRSLAGIAGSNTAEGMAVSLLRVFRVVWYGSLQLADPSSRGDLPSLIKRNSNVIHLQRGGRSGPKTLGCLSLVSV